MELPTHAEFGKLRLRRFIARGVRALKNWEYEGELWVGEAFGFTEVLRLQDDPKVVRSVAVDLEGLRERVQSRLLDALGLSLRRGMNLKQIVAVLGKPKRETKFVADRTTYDFRVAKPRYQVTCTVLQKGGLTYVTVMALGGER